jgi:hypothetical protein
MEARFSCEWQNPKEQEQSEAQPTVREEQRNKLEQMASFRESLQQISDFPELPSAISV